MGEIKGVNVNTTSSKIDEIFKKDVTPMSRSNLPTQQEIENVILEFESDFKQKVTDPVNHYMASTFNAQLNYTEIETDGFTTQGYTIVEDKNGNKKVLITAYDAGDDKTPIIGKAIDKAKGYENQNSRIYIYDEETGELEGVIILDNKDHVGGITYDKENGIVLVTSENGTVSTYNYSKMIDILEEIKSKMPPNDSTIPKFDMNDDEYKDNLEDEGIKIPNDINTWDATNQNDIAEEMGLVQQGMDSIYYYDGKIYSCTFSTNGELICTEVEYEKDKNGNVIGISEKGESNVIGDLNGATQGLSIYEEDGKKYLISASSAWGSSKSRITKWEMTDDGLKEVGRKYIDHPGLEGIEINPETGEITGVFEYNEKRVEIIGSKDDFNDEPQPQTDIWYKIGGGGWDASHNR